MSAVAAHPVPRAPRARLTAVPPLNKRQRAHTSPRLTAHARERCAEMGLDEETVRGIVLNPDITWATNPPGKKDQVVAKSDAHPDYAVPYFISDDGVPVIVTVVFATDVDYDRAGTTFIPKEQP